MIAAPTKRFDLIERLPLGEKLRLKVKEPSLNASARQQIIRYLMRHDSSLVFPDDWKWVWCVQHDPAGYNGTLPKRISRLHKLQRGTYLAEQTQSDLGELAKRWLPPKEESLYDFNDQLNWKAGEFGDNDSCFLTYNKSAMSSFREGGGRAMRRYTLDGDPQGRALVAPVEHGLLICNCYEKNGSYRTETYTLLLADYLGLGHKPLNAIYSGDPSHERRSPFYADGSHGYLVGEQEVIRPVDSDNIYYMYLA